MSLRSRVNERDCKDTTPNSQASICNHSRLMTVLASYRAYPQEVDSDCFSKFTECLYIPHGTPPHPLLP